MTTPAAFREGSLRHLEHRLNVLLWTVRRFRHYHEESDFCSMTWKIRHVVEEAQRVLYSARDLDRTCK